MINALYVPNFVLQRLQEVCPQGVSWVSKPKIRRFQCLFPFVCMSLIGFLQLENFNLLLPVDEILRDKVLNIHSWTLPSQLI